jgi:hypothetical protein
LLPPRASFAFRWTFGSLVPNSLDDLAIHQVHPLLLLNATLASWPSSSPLSDPWLLSTDLSQFKKLLAEHLDPSAFPVPAALLCTPLRKRPDCVALHSESPVPRVWLPFQRCQLTQTLEASFSLQRSWASPFEAFLQRRDRVCCFQHLFRSGAFLTNLLGLLPALQRLISHVASRAPLRTRRFSPGRGLCSLGSSGLLGSPSIQRCL